MDAPTCEADWDLDQKCSADLRMFGSPTGGPPGAVVVCGFHFDSWDADGKWDQDRKAFAEMVYEHLNTREAPVIVELTPTQGEHQQQWTLPPTVRLSRQPASLVAAPQATQQ